MSDLDLMEESRPRGARHAARRRRRERRRRRRSGFATVLAFVLVLGILGGAGYGGYAALRHLTATPDYAGAGHGTVTVHIKPGDSIATIAMRLEKAHVVKSAKAFNEAASKDPRALTVQPGYYKLNRQMAAALALDSLLDPSSKVLWRITVPEGLRVSKTLSLLANETGRPVSAYTKAAKAKQLGLPPAANGNLEGYLFPATYDFAPGAEPKSMLRRMVRRHVAEERKFHLNTEARRVGLNPHQAITVASLVQAEARPADFAKVARVTYNRLNKGMPLQYDSTVNYALGRSQLNVSVKDTGVGSAYNTYKHTGLPPGPIDSPGAAAIKAALHPARGAWLYFVTTNPKTGETKFTADPKEFNRFKQEFKRNSG